MIGFTDLRKFLHRGSVNWGWYIWRDDSRLSTWAKTSEDIPVPKEKANIYFNVNPCKMIKTADKRNTIADTAAVNALFGDFDAKHFGSLDAAVTCIRSAPLRPTVVTSSGGGYHGYWMLKDPFIIDDEDCLDRAKSLQYRWVELVKSDRGCKDLARILRLPGTLNVKKEYAPDFPSVKIVFADFSRLYSIEQIESILPRPQPRIEPRQRNFGRGYVEKVLQTESERVMYAADGTRNDQLNKSAFILGRLVAGGQVSHSRVEGVLVCAALGAGLSEAEALRTIDSGLKGGNNGKGV